MFGMLEVVIGLIFVLLLLSLLATTVMELLSSILALRGKNLEKALRNMLASSDAQARTYEAFTNNPMYRQMSQRRRAPSYLSADTFQSVLLHVLLKGEGSDQLVQKIEALPDENLKQVLLQLLQDADYQVDRFRDNMRTWYDQVMDRAAGWYKRHVQRILLVVGLLIAVIFNADTIAIYDRLESDPESLEQIVRMAEQFLAENPEGMLTDSVRTSVSQDTTAYGQAWEKIGILINEEIDQAATPLGLGWGNVAVQELTWQEWLYKVLGWIVTALAVSLGAPFWFDLLRKLVNIRGSGRKPDSTAST